jgi:hypothetical protein
MLALTHFVLPSLSFLTQTFDDDTGIPFRTWPRRQSTDYAGNQPESYRQTCTDRPRQDTSRFHPLSQINFFFFSRPRRAGAFLRKVSPRTPPLKFSEYKTVSLQKISTLGGA